MKKQLLNKARNATLKLERMINKGMIISCYQNEILNLIKKICVFLESETLPDKERVSSLVGSIGYLITDDDDFVNTAVGKEIIDVVNEFAELN